jgi:hypothetical protein
VHRELRAYGRTPDLAGSEIRRALFHIHRLSVNV